MNTIYIIICEKIDILNENFSENMQCTLVTKVLVAPENDSFHNTSRILL
jgi:hypothetical protein